MAFRSRMLSYWSKLYTDQTPSEQAMEPMLAALGRRYRAQHPFWGIGMFADFALLDDKIVLEIDGDSHDRPAQKEKDLVHAIKLHQAGWRVVRVSNEWTQGLANTRATLEEKAQAVARVLASPGKSLECLEQELAQLRQSYPNLLAAAAKRATSKRPARSKTVPAKQSAAKPRRSRASQSRAQT